VTGSSGLIVKTRFILDQNGCMQYDSSFFCRTNQEALRQYYADNNSERDMLNFTGSPTESSHSVTDSITPASNSTTFLPFLSENKTLEFDRAAAFNSTLAGLLDTNTTIYVYTAFILGSVFITSIRSMFFFKVCMTASKILHDNMFGCVLAATMRFFDKNPSGKHCVE
jgi:hypothetical protein